MVGRGPRILTQALDTQALDWPSVDRSLRWLDSGQLRVETPGGSRWTLIGRGPGPQAHLTIHHWKFLRRIVSGWDVGFAEAYMAGEVSSPDLVALLKLATRNARLAERFKMLQFPRLGLRVRHALNRNTRAGSRRNISAHYDLGNSFYSQWLDAGMSYSAAKFSPANPDLESAQTAKLDRVLDLLDAREGDRILEIGCGWGSFAERAFEKHDLTVTGITLSGEQLAYARRRIAGAIAAGRCELRLQDYRDVAGTYDRIVSIEMLEAVGAAYWSTYFAKLRECLRPGGTAVLQVITIDEDRFENYRRQPDFIQKHIFPGGMLPTKKTIEHETIKAGLQPVSQEFFGADYAHTLEQWNARFQGAWPKICALGHDQRFKRMWEYYLAYCQVGFDVQALDVGLYKITRPAR
jgi:cyclopropane-fatty-acyl-phospholipid synthase